MTAFTKKINIMFTKNFRATQLSSKNDPNADLFMASLTCEKNYLVKNLHATQLSSKNYPNADLFVASYTGEWNYLVSV